MVLDIIVVFLLFVVALLLTKGKPINIIVTHKVDAQPQPVIETKPELEVTEDDARREIANVLQDIWGVANED